MKEKRRFLHPKILAAERAAIFQFLLDEGVPSEGAKIPTVLVYDAYNKWRRQNQMPPSELVIDGFGKLLPKIYRRQSSNWPPAGHSLNCIYGLALRGAVL